MSHNCRTARLYPLKNVLRKNSVALLEKSILGFFFVIFFACVMTTAHFPSCCPPCHYANDIDITHWSSSILVTSCHLIHVMIVVMWLIGFSKMFFIVFVSSNLLRIKGDIISRCVLFLKCYDIDVMEGVGGGYRVWGDAPHATKQCTCTLVNGRQWGVE